MAQYYIPGQSRQTHLKTMTAFSLILGSAVNKQIEWKTKGKILPLLCN